jgi:hypothetical protein
MSKAIDLGKKPQDLVTILGADDRDRTHYPTLHLDSDDPKLADIPDSGECTIKYKVKHRTHSEENGDGKKKRSCSLTLEVHSIEPAAGKTYKKKNGDSDGGARKALSDYFKDR